MQYKLHRIYDDNGPQGYRVLIDKLWPRGISKQDAALDDWWKSFAPSDNLREWFGHDADKWDEFRKEYLHQLSEQKKEIKECLADVNQGTLVILYGAKDDKHTHARVFQEYLEKLNH
ncbi:DUF488 family protein [Alteromonas sp. ASW11-19]|uniref:DUF488 family protein n=1 Tax=Alteromonas salexigens TaxID=2982530 RepID=A0ABT2VRT9_9ALTE|nr:DUF488 family protein [Alteromonas salexigens]MCU7556039.1 DUF488 family protein [Alteromonas salexigens]